MTKSYTASALIILATASQAFHVQVPSRRGGGAALCMSQQDNCGSSRRDFARKFGVATIASILSLNAASASAAPSSSMYISEIKTLDMSLPSYGTISDAKARLEADEYKPEPETPERAVRKSKPKKEAEEQGGKQKSNSMLPSMNKSIKKKEPKQRPPKEEEEKEDVSSFEGVKTMDMSLPSYGDSAATKQKSAFAL